MPEPLSAFVGNGDDIVSVELSGMHWYYIRQALLAEIPELQHLARLQGNGVAMGPNAADYGAWVKCLQDGVAAIFVACQEAPNSIIDPTGPDTDIEQEWWDG